jgi:hypothetical protein
VWTNVISGEVHAAAARARIDVAASNIFFIRLSFNSDCQICCHRVASYASVNSQGSSIEVARFL